MRGRRPDATTLQDLQAQLGKGGFLGRAPLGIRETGVQVPALPLAGGVLRVRHSASPKPGFVIRKIRAVARKLVNQPLVEVSPRGQPGCWGSRFESGLLPLISVCLRLLTAFLWAFQMQG